MQKNKGILDDLDIENKKDPGTNLQLLRGFIIGAIIQFFIWILLLEGLHHSSDYNLTLIYTPIINIDIINYQMNGTDLIAYIGFLLGASAFPFSSNAANQPYRKLLLLGLILSFLAAIGLYLARSIVLDNEFFNEITNRIPETIFLAIFYFIMLTGVIFLFKSKSWRKGAFLILIGLLLMGFLP